MKVDEAFVRRVVESGVRGATHFKDKELVVVVGWLGEGVIIQKSTTI